MRDTWVYESDNALRIVSNTGNSNKVPEKLSDAMMQFLKYQNAHEAIKKRINVIKESSDYPHNFKGQMVDDLEWVLSLMN